ncbi:type VI secretion system baseplate subunit TssK [Pseudoduganella sp. GCM10020061]|uniref:type VI secretion system baseplate subunit TssK n=1 Tax=Pseudoduganella sp. GCM10020061 TaxID=3317345 RepID=UPI0036254094
MSLPLRVLWGEGLTLGPQHFQQSDEYHEARLQRLSSIISPHLWGLRHASWSKEHLANNVLVPTSLSLVFPDGEYFEGSEYEALPEAVDLGRLPADQHAFVFYASLPTLRLHGGNLDGESARFAPVVRSAPDLFTDGLPVEVHGLRRTVRLLNESESRDGFTSVPVVKIQRREGGGFEEDPDYMAPGLMVRAIPPLRFMVDSLLAKANAKIESLYSRHRQRGGQVLEVQNGDLVSFWMLHALNTAAAGFSHYSKYDHLHPEQLFRELTTLAGSLMTFSTRYSLRDLPNYQHDDPGQCFGKVTAVIRDLIDTVISTKYLIIPLSSEPNRPSQHVGKLDPTRIVGNTSLCLAVNADMPAIELLEAIPLRIKIASPEDLELLVMGALPGIPLTHLVQPPSEIPARPNTYYFSLENKSPLFEAMLKAQAVALFAPSGLPGLKLELFAIIN